jgi:ABC-type uncharacterized transport system permease subunit
MCPVVIGLVAAGVYAVAAGLITPGSMAPAWVVQAVLLATFTYAYVTTGAGAGAGAGRG